MFYNALFILLYLRVTDLYISNNLIFRAFHCTSLALLSLKNTIYYGESVVNCSSSTQTLHSVFSHFYFDDEDFYLKIIPIYFIQYICYDLKNCIKRIDLLVHHIICIAWSLLNFRHRLAFISFAILSEGVTFAYAIHSFKNQLIFRLLFTTIIRFPVWTVMLYTQYKSYIPGYDLLYYFNEFIASLMILMDCMWFFQNFKKLQKIINNDEQFQNK